MKNFRMIIIAKILLALAAASSAVAQVGPKAPISGGTLPRTLDCTVEVLNKSAEADAQGMVEVSGIAIDQGLLRLQATCKNAAGDTIVGKADLIVPVPGGSSKAGEFDFDTFIPTPSAMQVMPQSPLLEQIGQTSQLTVTATLDGIPTDVTGATETFYSSSNPAVLTVDENGLMTAQNNGRAVLLVLNEGRLGLAVAQVVSSSLSSISATPGAVILAPHSLLPAPSAQLVVQGQLANATQIDLTSASAGTGYVSANESITQVTADGLLVALGSGMTSVTASNSGHDDIVAVEVRPTFTPAPLTTLDIAGGCAHNLDIVGSLLYVADDTNGLVIFDRNSGYVSKLAFGSRALDVKVRGTLAAVGLNNGIALVDVADPQLPQEIQRLTAPGATRDLWISGDTLYAAGGGDLFVFDIADPSVPVLIGNQSFGSTVKAVAGDQARGLAVALTSASALEVVRLASGVPGPSVAVAIPNGLKDDVFLKGTTALIANGTQGIHAVDISDPENPSRTDNSQILVNALGVAAREVRGSVIVAVADNIFVDTVPLFDRSLTHLLNLNFGGDANGTGMALGNGYGAVAVCSQGLKLFSTDEVTDNAGQPPLVTLTAPVQGDTLDENRDHTMTALATDDIGVDRVEFFVDGVLESSDSSLPYVGEFNRPAGFYDLRAEAVDGGGNRGVSQTVTVDLIVPPSPPDPGTVLAEQKVSTGNGGLPGPLMSGDLFGRAVATLGDLDGPSGASVQTIAVGAPRDDDGGGAGDQGAVYILFLAADGTVDSQQKISPTAGGFIGVLNDFDEFGSSVASLGDLDGDGVVDLAVGAIGDDDGGFGTGALWIVFLNADGKVKDHHKVSATSDMAGLLDAGDNFGAAVTSLGFHGGGSHLAVVVGAPFDDDGTADAGASWTLYLNPDGTVDHHQKISSTAGGFTDPLASTSLFGSALAPLGDLDGDGIDDVVIGAQGDSEIGFFRGAIYNAFLNADGTVKSSQKINGANGGFTGTLDDLDFFGSAVALLGDIDGDGISDLAVSAYLDDDGGSDRGATWILFSNADGTVKGHQKVSSTMGGFSGVLSDGDEFGSALAPLGDLDGDGVMDLVVGANRDDDGSMDSGGLWVLSLDGFP